MFNVIALQVKHVNVIPLFPGTALMLNAAVVYEKGFFSNTFPYW